MKNFSLTILLCILYVGITSAQAVDDDGCTGAVGDVKYSVLDEAQFVHENGACWTLLDGDPIPVTDRLAILTGWSSLPDARGVFIRSLDTRTSNRVDADRDVGDEPGHIQQDRLRRHRHEHEDRYDSDDGGGTPTLAGNDKEPNGDGDSNLRRRYRKIKTRYSGGSETRPVNIILYTYIRTK